MKTFCQRGKKIRYKENLGLIGYIYKGLINLAPELSEYQVAPL